MPKRQRKNDPAVPDENANDDMQVKKVKVGNNGTTKCIWESEGDKAVWTPYSNTQMQEIVEALRDGKTKIEVTGGKVKSEIVFERMVQRNVLTGWERQVRCRLAGETDSKQWEFLQSNHGNASNWVLYPADTSRLLEAAYLCNLPTISVTSQSKRFNIDLVKFVELTKTGKVSGRKVRRNSLLTSASDKDLKMDSVLPVNTKKKIKKEKEIKKEPNCTVKEADTKKEFKSVVFSGKAPVDSFCSLKNKVHVFCEGRDIWDTMLNQTNVMNNNNKYYLIQLLEDNNARKFYVWQRWGRVGYDGQNNLVTCGGDLEKAKTVFAKKFSDKTMNTWENRQDFTKVQGKYDMLIMDYSDKNKDKPDGPVKPEKPVPVSKLDERIQTLITLICNVKAMEEMLKEMKYDTKKAPLGKLTTDQIKAGYETLKEIDHCIRNNDFGSKLVKACDEFYTRIPHCFGMKRPPLIRSKDEVKLKLELLEALGDIEIAIRAMKAEDEESENPVDRRYKSLGCDLQPLDHDHVDFKMVEKYVKNTHAKTHIGYTMEVLDVFDVRHRTLAFKDVGNRMLLWHGSRLTNWAGILTQGLRIAPPEAPVTGYMFGKGIYFADMSSKSANYCFTTRSKNIGLVLLSEVALGKSRELLAADYNAGDLLDGYHSVKGMGQLAPNPEESITLSDGLVVPCGQAINTGVTNPKGYTLNYNEYIVYDPAQVRMRYLVKLQFNYK